MYSLRFVFALLGVVTGHGVLFAQSVSRADRERLWQLHESLEQVREEVYGNCSYSATQTIVLSGTGVSGEDAKPQVVRYKVWTRENEYIRVDVFEKPDLKIPTLRIVVRPDGFAKLSPNKDGDMVMSDWGSSNLEKGLSQIRGMYIYLPSTNFPRSNLELWFGRFIGLPVWSEHAPRCVVSNVSFDGEILSFESKMDQISDGWRLDRLNVERPAKVTLAHHAKINLIMATGGMIKSISDSVTRSDNITDQTTSAEAKITAEYDDALHQHIPLKVVRRSEGSSGFNSEITVVFADVKLEPAPLEVFAVEGLGLAGYTSKGTWFRRLILLGVGLGSIGLYVYTRRKAKAE